MLSEIGSGITHELSGGSANNCFVSKPTRAALIGAVIAALITLPGLALGTLWDNSETAYGEVAREILLTHDWIVMHSNGLPWFVQPPLYFWIGAVFAKVLGVGTFALRLPAALATIAMGGMTGYAVTRQAGSRAGIFASVILSTSLMQAVVGRLAIMDALLDLAVAFTIFWWFRALQTGRDRYAVYGWIAAAFGFLAKGPVAPVIALLVIVPYAIWERRSESSWRGWIGGALLFFAIVVPWFAALAHQAGFATLRIMIGHYTFGRYTGVIENQSGPFWYYIPVVILGFFPWVAFLPVAIAWGARFLRNPDDPTIARLLRLAFVWSIVPFVFFSFAKTKLPNYIALELPALALLVGLYFDAIARKQGSRAATVSAACVPVFIGILAVAATIFIHSNHFPTNAHAVLWDLSAMGATIFCGAILTVILLLRRQTAYVPYALGAAMFLAVDTLAIFIVPQAEAFKPVPQLAQVINANLQPGDAIAIQSISGSNALLFYTRPPVTVLPAPDVTHVPHGALARDFICAAPRAFVIAPKQRPAYDPTYGRDRKILAQSTRAILFLYSGSQCVRNGS
jgi:4-amino-4-deoxy-L-arabinose transferase-like glycosyltransferase